MKKIAFILLLSSYSLIACRTNPPSQQASYSGTFRSMKGVFNPISCYCGNGGYLQTETGEAIPICLKENQEVACLRITVQGNFINLAAPTEPTSPCPRVIMSIFKVQALKCL